jgi:hypothetical protein
MLGEHARMSIAYRPATLLAATAVFLLTVPLGGCATSTTSSSLMDAHAEVPAPQKPTAYLPVEDVPPPPDVMKAVDQSKLKKELIAARERQAAAAKAQGGGTPTPADQASSQTARHEGNTSVLHPGLE